MNLFNFLKNKYKNRKIKKWEQKNRETLQNLMRFDLRTDEIPEDLQKSRKLGYLLRRKKWLHKGQFDKWYRALTVDKILTKNNPEDEESDLIVY